MALILAINPGNSHSPTLARLARELRGCELIGAESCKVAITAINQRVPDVVLLPDRPPRGEAELFARLKAVPGGVPTLQLPPVASADPVALAKAIRKLLAGEATPPGPAPIARPVGVARPVATTQPVATVRSIATKPAGASPHVMAAARAAVTWIRLQRAQWDDLDALDVAVEPDPHEPDESASAPNTDRPTALRQAQGVPSVSRDAAGLHEPHEPQEPAAPKFAASTSGDAARSNEPLEPHEPYEPRERNEPYERKEPYEPHEPYERHEPYEPHEPAKRTVAWLPRMAGLAAAVGLVVAGVWFWPQISGNATNSAAESGTPSDPARVDTRVPPPPSEPSPPREPIATETDAAAINLTPQTTIRVTSNEPGEVLIDGKNAGRTPFDSQIPIGSHTVTVRTAGGERQFTIEATMKPVRLNADFSKPQP